MIGDASAEGEAAQNGNGCGGEKGSQQHADMWGRGCFENVDGQQRGGTDGQECSGQGGEDTEGGVFDDQDGADLPGRSAQGAKEHAFAKAHVAAIEKGAGDDGQRRDEREAAQKRDHPGDLREQGADGFQNLGQVNGGNVGIVPREALLQPANCGGIWRASGHHMKAGGPLQRTRGERP